TDEQVLFLTDILPTGYMAAENCNIHGGDIVAVWGCGPVGLLAIKSAFVLGAERVIAIDFVARRLEMAKALGAEVVNAKEQNPVETLREMTGGRGPDSCLDAVGLEAHGFGIEGVYDKVKHTLRQETDRPNVLRQAITACRKGGTVSLAGVYGGFVDKIPMGAAFNKGLTLHMGQTHVHRYLHPLLDKIMSREIDATFVISHRLPLEKAPEAYRMFRDSKDECTKVVLRPHG
ncbi:MAG TPA: zinc-binding dehydrogenase, partial [Chthoniobacterales bacterium]